ncbi:MAG TPA: hypothetical protein PKV75_11640 [Desulfobacterales bacterium]|nr:hypothetical protein [Desulfobacterales bacterium]
MLPWKTYLDFFIQKKAIQPGFIEEIYYYSVYLDRPQFILAPVNDLAMVAAGGYVIKTPEKAVHKGRAMFNILGSVHLYRTDTT